MTVTAHVPKVYDIQSDHLNTPRVITDSTGTEVWRWDSAPFGETVANENPAGKGIFACNLRFPGQYYDKETGLHYNYFRDYDPSTGRYVESDPIRLEGGINTYGYVEGNPVSNIDPLGLATYLCLGKPDNYEHAWVCGDDYCSGFNPAPEPSSSNLATAIAAARAVTTGIPGKWTPEEPRSKYKTDQYCQETKPPKTCDQKKFDQCVKDKSKPGIKGRYHVVTNQCIAQAMTIIGQCILECK
ncbi:RHS repeat domain-containing protein [Undibacterium sp. Xuan67W]|uniref:RHS repeat domain-containing protein n=1 Tax=Undibacterium sp. Xuan67W TaxID=3413057 RepID=UPI003BF4BB80